MLEIRPTHAGDNEAERALPLYGRGFQPVSRRVVILRIARVFKIFRHGLEARATKARATYDSVQPKQPCRGDRRRVALGHLQLMFPRPRWKQDFVEIDV